MSYKHSQPRNTGMSCQTNELQTFTAAEHGNELSGE